MIETKRKVEQVIQTAQKHRQDQHVQRMEFQKSTKSEWYFADMCSRFVDFFFCRIRVVLNFPHFVAPPKLSTERRKLTGGHRACPGSCFGYSWGCGWCIGWSSCCEMLDHLVFRGSLFYQYRLVATCNTYESEWNLPRWHYYDKTVRCFHQTKIVLELKIASV